LHNIHVQGVPIAVDLIKLEDHFSEESELCCRKPEMLYSPSFDSSELTALQTWSDIFFLST